MSTNARELNEWILEQLSGGRDPDDLIPAICEATGKSWKEASALVYGIQQHRGDEILRRQSPLLVILAFFSFLGGTACLGYAAYLLVNLMGLPSFGPSLDSESTYILRRFIELTVTGAGLLMGSLLGMRDVWAAFLFPNQPTD